MSDQPKVSERMFNLVECAVAAAHSWPKPICIADVPSEEIINGYYLKMLLSAIAEIEQRAEETEQERDALMSCLCFAWNLEYPTTNDALTTAACQLFGRAEKWKEAALAHVALLQSLSGSVDEINAASKKTVDACKALGDEWDEAVR